MTMNQIDENVYKAAHETAVLHSHTHANMLKIHGETRLDLIHRMSTQDIIGLKEGQGAATILTTDIGRIIDRLILYTSSDTVYALTGDGNGDTIARYLMRFVFFNDDFHVQDISEKTAVFGIYGPQAKAKLMEIGFPDVDLPLHHWQSVKINEMYVYLHRVAPIGGDGYFVTSREDDREAIWQLLNSTGLTIADESAYDALRIESGLPRFGREMTANYIPLETGLWADVSFNKGCYTGQEIIARMESRGRVAKQLVQLTAAAPIEQGATIRANGKKAGTITSTAVTPSGTIALGYVKTAVLEADKELMVGETAVRRQPPTIT